MKTDKRLLEEVVAFIKDKYGFEVIDENTRLEEDLGITGDEAWDFFVDYKKKFDVDISNFFLYDYFQSEGCDLLVFLGFKKPKVKKVFIVRDLINGIKTGRLAESTIGKDIQ